jgi:hypothetical protein
MVCHARVRYRTASSSRTASTLVHVQGLPFQEKGEVVEAERHGILKYPQPLRPFDRHTDVDVFGGACSLRKSEFKGNAAF